jgi:hypothetical protein
MGFLDAVDGQYKTFCRRCRQNPGDAPARLIAIGLSSLPETFYMRLEINNEYEIPNSAHPVIVRAD